MLLPRAGRNRQDTGKRLMLADLNIYLGVVLAGLASFLSPCVLPLVPPYLGYLGGTTISQGTVADGIDPRVYRRIVLGSLFFVAGFSTVFVSLGAGASLFGGFIAIYKSQLSIAAGLVIILFGLHFLGLLRIPFLYQEARIHTNIQSVSLIGAYIIGLAFAFGWTPCVGPVLATVLAVASNEGSAGAGAGLLAAYSLGLGIPFILAAIAIRPFLSLMQRFKRHLGVVEKIMGVVLVLTGIAILNIFPWFSIAALAQWTLETFPGLAAVEEWFTSKSLQGDIMKQTLPPKP
jgi:cytochrome c-type biogenesis protein